MLRRVDCSGVCASLEGSLRAFPGPSSSLSSLSSSPSLSEKGTIRASGTPSSLCRCSESCLPGGASLTCMPSALAPVAEAST